MLVSKVRNARSIWRSEDDLEAINGLLVQLSPHRPRHADTAAAIAHCMKRGMTLFVCRDDSRRIVGMACLIAVETFSGRKGLVEDVVVDEACRGKGVGRALMRTLVDEARQDGMLRLELTSAPHRTAANAMYLALGFERRDTNLYRLRLQ